MKRTLRIGLVELYATGDGTLFGSRMRDLYSVVRLPSRSIDLLAAILRERGFTSVQTFNPLYNAHRGRFHASELEELSGMDVVGISAITRTAPPSYALARCLKERNPAIRVLLGGPHVTALPEEGLRHADVVVRREGDATLPDLAERLAESPDDPDLAGVPGISFRDRRGAVRHNPDRAFLSSDELSRLPFPMYAPAVCKGITNSVVVTSRGCPFQCDFCAVISHFGDRYRYLAPDRAVELIEHTLRQTRKPIFFGDDNFDARPARTRAILERILERGVVMPPWGAQVRVETAGQTDLLRLMRRAGCQRVYVGFESINEKTLRLFNKRSTREKNERAIRGFHEAGLAIHGMFVLGSDEDTVDTVRETVRFAKRTNLDTAQFFALTALPGTPLTARYGERDKVLSREWHLYDAHHVVVRPERLSPHVLQRELVRAHRQFYSWTEAVRHLLLARGRRLVNAHYRVIGSLLALWILLQTGGHRRRLRALERWSREVETRYARIRRQVGSKVQQLGKGLSPASVPGLSSAEEFARWLRRSLEALPQEFLPYCHRYLVPKIEALRKALPAVAHAWDPFPAR